MPYSSNSFLCFKWWRTPGIDAAVWFCHTETEEASSLSQLPRAILDLDDIKISHLLISMFHLGQPSTWNRIYSGNQNIWVTGQTIAKGQGDGQFPIYFENIDNLKIAGIIINRVDGSDRPNYVASDMCLDIIFTFVLNSKLPPIYHRERIPEWTSSQQSTFGRYTTGPLSTVWSKV